MTLPNNWELKTIGDICLPPQYGWTTSAKPSGDLHLLRTTDITSGSINWDTVPYCTKEPGDIDKYLLHDGDIVISRAGSVGYSRLIKNPRRAVFASYLIRFRPIINEKYVSYFLQSPSYWQAISEKRLGIAIPNVNATKLKQISIPVPPLPEQECIVECIESLFTQLDAGVAGLKRAQAALKRYRASVLKAACEGRLVPQDPNDEPAEELLKRILAEKGEKADKIPVPNGDLPELPEGWVWTKVGYIVATEPNSFTDGPFGSKLKTSHYTNVGPRVIRLQNIGDGTFNDEYAHISQEHFETLRKHEVFEGDLVIGALGDSLPRACIIPDFVGLAIVKADCMRFKPNPKVASNKFMNFALNSEVVKRQAVKITHGIGRPRLNQSEVKSLPIPLPPRDEQDRIVAEVECRLSVVDVLEQAVSASLNRAARLRQAILRRAFEGQLVFQPVIYASMPMIVEENMGEQ